MIALGDLEGRWTLSRRIEDHLAGLTGRLEGQSIWSRDDDGLVQEESGLLHYGAAPPMQATRRYLWREEGGHLVVLFEDGRPFHAVGSAPVTHECAPDRYVVRYRFDSREQWQAEWRVTGPRKDATIFSRYSRLIR